MTQSEQGLKSQYHMRGNCFAKAGCEQTTVNRLGLEGLIVCRCKELLPVKRIFVGVYKEGKVTESPEQKYDLQEPFSNVILFEKCAFDLFDTGKGCNEGESKIRVGDERNWSLRMFVKSQCYTNARFLV